MKNLPERTANNLKAKISRNAKDAIQKYASGLFRDATLGLYGVETAPIKELVNVELPIVEASGSLADSVFLLADDTYLHYEFVTRYRAADLPRFARYDIRLFERDGRIVRTVIIYTADVKTARTELNIGSLRYNPDKIMMREYDGDAIFAELSAKITAGEALTDADMLNLTFLPLMRVSKPRDELAAESIKLAQSIPDDTKRNTCIAAAFAFASKYLDKNQLQKLLEAIKMTDLATMLIEEALDKRDIEIARNFMREGVDIATVATATGLDESTIEHIKSELGG